MVEGIFIYYKYIHIAPADCPPETGGTRSEATEGVDKTTHYYLLLFHPLPTAWYSPLSQGEKVGARVLQEQCDYIFTSRQQTVPLRQGRRGAK